MPRAKQERVSDAARGLEGMCRNGIGLPRLEAASPCGLAWPSLSEVVRARRRLLCYGRT
jgi:hypothetical protein